MLHKIDIIGSVLEKKMTINFAVGTSLFFHNLSWV